MQRLKICIVSAHNTIIHILPPESRRNHVSNLSDIIIVPRFLHNVTDNVQCTTYKNACTQIALQFLFVLLQQEMAFWFDRALHGHIFIAYILHRHIRSTPYKDK